MYMKKFSTLLFLVSISISGFGQEDDTIRDLLPYEDAAC